VDFEYGVDDPSLGEVSCDDEASALRYASETNGQAWVKSWKDGEVICKENLPAGGEVFGI
jgi:hypothetical protein